MNSDFVDKHGRKVKSLRISLTNRCNLNCIYCHGEGETDHTNINNIKDEITPETIRVLTDVAVKHGVDKVKFSGGEPLLRRDLPEILTELPPLRDVSLTTNGTLLSTRADDLADSGLDRVNISLDTLHPLIYDRITRTTGYHNKVLNGIHAAVCAGLTPIKINMVLLRGINDNEIAEMVAFVKCYNGCVILQLIELMDFQNTSSYRVNIDKIQQELERQASHTKVRIMHRRKKYYINGAEVELVRPVDNTEFCQNCNRLRVTPESKLKTCLLRDDDLVDITNKTPLEVEQLMIQTIQKREPYCKLHRKHDVP